MAPLPAREVHADTPGGIPDRPTVLVALGFDAHERAPAVALRHRLAEDRAIDGSEQVVTTGQLPDRGPDEQLERHRRGDGIPRQPEQQDRRSAAGTRGCAEREWFARLDRDAPEIDVADRLERRLHDVVRPDRNPTRHDDRVNTAVERVSEATEDVVEV